MNNNYLFQLPLKVRDYECDLQGIVNNAVYLHYTEHTRHEFLASRGISFARLHQEGIDAVVARMSLAYKTPLHSGNSFLSCLNIEKQRIKYIFRQDIYRLPDMKCCLKSTVETVCLVNGQLSSCPQLDALLSSSFNPQ